MGLFDEPLNDLQANCLEQWDYSPAFPSGYTGTKGVIVLPASHWQLLEQIETLSNAGQMTEPIISIVDGSSREETRSFSDIYGPGSGVTTRYAVRVKVPFLISVWADQQMGGQMMCRQLAGQIQGAIFFYRNRLTTVRHLRVLSAKEAEGRASQLWRFDVAVVGDSLVSYDN
jgi:hypothetical protein